VLDNLPGFCKQRVSRGRHPDSDGQTALGPALVQDDLYQLNC
jgi:hypothetical protein